MTVKSAIAVDYDHVNNIYYACVSSGEFADAQAQKPIRHDQVLFTGTSDGIDKIIPWLVEQAVARIKLKFNPREPVQIHLIGSARSQARMYISGMDVRVQGHADFDRLPNHMKYLYARAREQAEKRIGRVD